MLILNDPFLEFVPTLSPVSPVFPHSYMGQECGVDKKYRLVSPSNERVPDEVYQKLAFKMQNFKNGYFNFKLENKGQEIRVTLKYSRMNF